MVNSGSASYSASVLMPAASVHVCLNELADIMIDKMLQPGLIFAPTPFGPRTQGQRQDPGLCLNNANT